MKVGLISDTHENMPMIRKAVSFLNKENVKLVIHCGDIISPITYSEFKKLKCKMLCVFGNNDGDRDFLREKFKKLAEFYSSPYPLCMGKKKLLIMHEPFHIDSFIKSRNYHIIIYGHTHYREKKRKNGVLVINPGEVGGWLTGQCTFCILDTKNEHVEFIKI